MKKTFYALFFSTITSIATAAPEQPEVVPGEYIVQLKEGFELTDFQSQSQHGLVINSIPDMNMLVIKRPLHEEPREIISSLESDPRVEFAEPNYVYHSLRTPNDPAFKDQWGINNTEYPHLDLGLTKAWDLQTGSEKIIVGIIDTGINYKHPSLKDNMWVNEAEKNGKRGIDDDGNGYIDDIYGYNFADNDGDPMDDQMHGSHCAGVIGAKGNDGIDIAGINWNVRMMALKFLNAKGSGATDDAIKAIDYGIKMKARILSNSWGGGGSSKALNNAIARANAAGILFVAAAGNDGKSNDKFPTFPANYKQPNIITVASIGPAGTRSLFSNFGSSVHIAAPGERILSTVLKSGIERLSGTSMATPHVTGVAALVLAQNPRMTVAELKARLLKSALKPAGLTGITKYGLVNAYNAVKNINVPAPAKTEEDAE